LGKTRTVKALRALLGDEALAGSLALDPGLHGHLKAALNAADKKDEGEEGVANIVV
jgi:hypothetical protein